MVGLIITGPASDCLDAVEQVTKSAVIHLHPVIEVEDDAHIGVVAQYLVVGQEFGVFLFELFDFLGQFVAGGGA